MLCWLFIPSEDSTAYLRSRVIALSLWGPGTMLLESIAIVSILQAILQDPYDENTVMFAFPDISIDSDGMMRVQSSTTFSMSHIEDLLGGPQAGSAYAIFRDTVRPLMGYAMWGAWFIALIHYFRPKPTV